MSSPSDDLRKLIDQMKTEEREHAIEEALELVPDDSPADDIVPAVNATATREVFKQLALVKLQIAALQKVEKQLVAAGNFMIGEHHGIKAGSETLAKHTTNPVTRVNTEIIKEHFPPADYPQFYKTTEETRLLLDVEFKRTVFAEATQNQEIEK